MDFSQSSESIKKICQSIEERDQTIVENNVKIKYYNNQTEKLNSEISIMKRRNEKIDEEIAFHKEQNKYFQLIQESLEEGSKTMQKCIANHQTFEIIMAKYSKMNELEEQTAKDDFNKMYTKIKKYLESNLLYQQLEEKKIAYLKADIELRQEEVKVKVLKRIISQKLEIQKKIFYNYFIDLATKYIEERKSKEQLQNNQNYIVQEKSMKTNHIEKQNSNMEKTIQSNYNIDLNQKISEILQKDSDEIIPQKIRIVSERIIVPAFKDYSESTNSGTRSKKGAWLQKWKKRLVSRKSTRNTSKLQDSFVSQQSNQSFSQETKETERNTTEEQSQQCVDKEGMKSSQELIKPFMNQTIVENISMNDKNTNIESNIMKNSQVSNVCDEDLEHFQTTVKTPLPTVLPQAEIKRPLPIIKPTSVKENKSVHFNLTSEKESDFNFQPFMIENKFSSFFTKPAGPDNSLTFGNISNNELNISSVNTDAVQDDFKNLQSTIQFSPEYQYETYAEPNTNFLNFGSSSMMNAFEKQTDKPSESGKRMFSFGSSYNPFQ